MIGSESNESSQNSGSKDMIKLSYTFPNPEISDDNGYDLVSIPGLGLYSIPSEPLIPFKTAKILIPPNKDVDKIEIGPSVKSDLSGIFNIQFGQEPIPIIPNQTLRLTTMEP